MRDPGGYFHVISKDTGFDPLLQHLRGQKILAARAATIEDIPRVRTGTGPGPSARVSRTN